MVQNRQKGFTLVELSIVIVIIGLIVAGVVGGQALIRQAQLRSIISEQAAVKTAIKAFRSEYNAAPGDFENAHAYWDDGADGVCGTAAQCNGDGDRMIEIVAAAAEENEAYRAWQHLSLAGLFTGAFTGVAIGTGNDGGERGANLPASRYPDVSITLHTETNLRENHIIFGADVVNAISNGDIFTVAEAVSLDEKMDDNAPGRGMVRADGSTSADCFDSADAYNLDNDVGTPCFIWIRD